MIVPEVIEKEFSVEIVFPIFTKLQLFVTLFFGNAIFIATLIFGEILPAVPIFMVVLFYLVCNALLFWRYYYGKQGGRTTFFFHENELIVKNSEDRGNRMHWFINYEEKFPYDALVKIIYKKSDPSLTYVLPNRNRIFELSSHIPSPLVLQTLEIINNKTGVCFDVVP